MAGGTIDINIEVDEPNRWRLETPGTQGWKRTARPNDPNKYLMISADCHAGEPANLWVDRIEPEYRNRLPRTEIDEKGVKWSISEGWQKSRLLDMKLDGEDGVRAKAGSSPAERIKDDIRDGVDAEIIFPNRGLMMWATPDPAFAEAQCRVYNTWAWEAYGPYNDRLSPMACIAPGVVEGAIKEIARCAKLGFRGISLPCKPIFGPHDSRHPNYNLAIYDPMWKLIEEAGLPVTFHVSTGRDPRVARKDGGAVINYVSHALTQTVEPLACVCASGVIERFPGIHFSGIECGIGWVAWSIDAMDEAYRKHHMWAFPKLKKMPSEYFHSNCSASFQEDRVGLDTCVKYGLVDNIMWANDYPHHEGSWPHSAPAIERQMGHLTDEQRAKILGLNAARIFKFDGDALIKRHRERLSAGAN